MMTAQEFDEKLKELTKKFESSKVKLENKYLKSLVKFNIGDIIKQGPITIEVTGYTHFYGLYEVRPDIVYKGKILNKFKLTPNKKEIGIVGRIYGNTDTTLILTKTFLDWLHVGNKEKETV
jgi:hypothetical protein